MHGCSIRASCADCNRQLRDTSHEKHGVPSPPAQAQRLLVVHESMPGFRLAHKTEAALPSSSMNNLKAVALGGGPPLAVVRMTTTCRFISARTIPTGHTRRRRQHQISKHLLIRNSSWMISSLYAFPLICSRPASQLYGAPPRLLDLGSEAVRRCRCQQNIAYCSGGYITPTNAAEELEKPNMEREAWELLRKAMVVYCGSPVGTIAACDPAADASPLNYDQVFIRDFIPSAIAFLLNGEPEIVRSFLLHTLQLQSWEKTVDWYSPGQGLMPASFKVRLVPRENDNTIATEETLDPDFGEAAIGRVAPVDSGLWWIILLRAYGKCTGDLSLQKRIDVQTGVKMILKLCLEDGFDMFPTLLVTDGSCMIDRRMGIHGHPLEIQALFFSALRCAREMLNPEDDLIRAIIRRLIALSFHIREYYWLDIKKLNEIYRYKTEEYSSEAVNKFNIYPDQIPSWLVEWMPDLGGYLIGNLQPAHMDFRFFSLGNLWSIVGSLATPEQSNAILDLIEAKWTDLVGNMPLKICYPALEGEEWHLITGSDPKNTPWSYHNGGSWPTLLWQLTVAALKMKRPGIARKAVEVAERRLSKDRWPEYYDIRAGKMIGKQSRLYQTWTIAGYLVSKQLLRKPDAFQILTCEEDAALLEARSLLQASPKRKRGHKTATKPFVV